MNIDLLKGIALFVILLLVQVLVLNHIHLFGFATPLLYMYVALIFRRNYPRWGILLWCFVMGLAIDIFSNTPGMAAASMTLLGFLQPYILQPFTNRDTPDDFQRSLRQMGPANFLWYAAICVFVYCLVFFTIEDFSFFNPLYWMGSVVGSSLLTFIFVLVIENFRSK